MSEWLVILGIGGHALSGVPGLFCKRDANTGQALAVALAIVASLLGIAGALGSLVGPVVATPFIKIDGISVIFMLPIFLISALGSIYGLGYWKQSEHPLNGRKLRLFYGLVTASLVAVTIVANAILFLIAWEIMALGAFFLITTEDEKIKIREAGWIYMIATHTATLSLFAMFALMRNATGSFELTALHAGAATPEVTTVIFILAMIGFGLKAGVIPLHVWLPGAHAMAPSHVSALMSGVLIKIGIYGLIRIVSLLPNPPLWWGGAVLTLGAISGVLGVVFALGQHDLKRLLAYHSIENIGIIVMGLGLAMVGRSLHNMVFVTLGLAGAFLHVWNHGLFKSLLFFGAGAVIHTTHTREIDHMGGLAQLMPRTAICFAVGAVAICGLPPLNGFVSELFIYLGLFRTLGFANEAGWPEAAFAVPVLAMIGALAVACFVKVFGAVFLGTARSEHAQRAHEVGANMMGPMWVLVGCCLLIGLAPLLVAPVLEQGIRAWLPELAIRSPQLATLAPLGWISLGGVALIGLSIVASLLLGNRLRQQGTASTETWACGFVAPGPTMQYTSSSFAQLLVDFFAWVLRPHVHASTEQPLFAGKTRFSSHVPDLVLDGALRPGFRFGAKIAASFRFLQAGSIHVYLFYIVVFLILLLLWR